MKKLIKKHCPECEALTEHLEYGTVRCYGTSLTSCGKEYKENNAPTRCYCGAYQWSFRRIIPTMHVCKNGHRYPEHRMLTILTKRADEREKFIQFMRAEGYRECSGDIQNMLGTIEFCHDTRNGIAVYGVTGYMRRIMTSGFCGAQMSPIVLSGSPSKGTQVYEFPIGTRLCTVQERLVEFFKGQEVRERNLKLRQQMISYVKSGNFNVAKAMKKEHNLGISVGSIKRQDRDAYLVRRILDNKLAQSRREMLNNVQIYELQDIPFIIPEELRVTAIGSQEVFDAIMDHPVLGHRLLKHLCTDNLKRMHRMYKLNRIKESTCQ